MRKILFATKNKSKIKEFKDILSPFDINIITLNDLNRDYEIIEDGNTFEENALLKQIYCKRNEYANNRR